MGDIQHDGLMIVGSDYKADGWTAVVEAFREEYKDEINGLLVGPIRAVTNGYVTYFYAPDGSKEGWPESDLHDRLRNELIERVVNSPKGYMASVLSVGTGVYCEASATLIECDDPDGDSIADEVYSGKRCAVCEDVIQPGEATHMYHLTGEISHEKCWTD